MKLHRLDYTDTYTRCSLETHNTSYNTSWVLLLFVLLTVTVTRTLNETQHSLLLLCPAVFFLLWQSKMCQQYISHTPESGNRKQLFINSALYRLLCTDTNLIDLFCKLVFFIRRTKWLLEASSFNTVNGICLGAIILLLGRPVVRNWDRPLTLCISVTVPGTKDQSTESAALKKKPQVSMWAVSYKTAFLYVSLCRRNQAAINW